jgi:YD repeat-containing protein
VTIPQGSTHIQRSLDFDANGYLTADTRAFGSTNPAAEKTTYSRDSATELVISITDPLLRVTNFIYDGNNSNITLANLTRVTEAAGTMQASPTNITWQTSPGFYDEISSITDPLNHTWTFGIDPSTGDVTSVKEPLGNTWTAGYNTGGQIKSWADPLQETTRFGYSSTTGDLASITDPLNNVTNLVTDSVGRVTSATTPMQETASFVYDAMNHVTSSTDPNGNSTT